MKIMVEVILDPPPPHVIYNDTTTINFWTTTMAMGQSILCVTLNMKTKIHHVMQYTYCSAGYHMLSGMHSCCAYARTTSAQLQQSVLRYPFLLPFKYGRTRAVKQSPSLAKMEICFWLLPS